MQRYFIPFVHGWSALLVSRPSSGNRHTSGGRDGSVRGDHMDTMEERSSSVQKVWSCQGFSSPANTLFFTSFVYYSSIFLCIFVYSWASQAWKKKNQCQDLCESKRKHPIGTNKDYEVKLNWPEVFSQVLAHKSKHCAGPDFSTLHFHTSFSSSRICSFYL